MPAMHYRMFDELGPERPRCACWTGRPRPSSSPVDRRRCQSAGAVAGWRQRPASRRGRRDERTASSPSTELSARHRHGHREHQGRADHAGRRDRGDAPAGRTRCRCRGPAGPRWTRPRSGGVTWSRWRGELMDQRAGRPIAGMCVSGVGPCLLVCDEKLEPVRPAILYGIDGRAGGGDRGADRAARRRGDLRPLRQGAVHPGGRAEDGMVPPARAGGLGTRALGTTPTPTSRPS